MPSTATVPSGEGSLKPPIGISDFGELYRKEYTFVDKSLLIKEVLEDSAKVSLITRPRRFGKTLNLSMLHHFFADKVNGHSTRKLFRSLAVADEPQVMAHQGKYSVVFVTLKDVKEPSYQEAAAKLTGIAASLYDQHRELARSKRLSAQQRARFRCLMDGKADSSEIKDALRALCQYLSVHYKKPVILLIDEYDAPMHAAHQHGYFADIAGFMRGFLGAALKDNSFLHKAIVTGVLRISKESLFSGLNNIEVNTLLSREYGQWFGFTESEVAELLLLLSTEIPEAKNLGQRIRGWYNGYRFGDSVMYNPWSILCCLKHEGITEPYWVNTSDNALLKQVMGRAAADSKKQLEQLVRGETLAQTIDPNLAFGDLENNADALWSLLLFTGYLTTSDIERDELGRIECKLRIPNQEVLGLYGRNFTEWFTDALSATGYAALLNSPASFSG